MSKKNLQTVSLVPIRSLVLWWFVRFGPPMRFPNTLRVAEPVWCSVSQMLSVRMTTAAFAQMLQSRQCMFWHFRDFWLVCAGCEFPTTMGQAVVIGELVCASLSAERCTTTRATVGGPISLSCAQATANFPFYPGTSFNVPINARR